MTTRDPSHHPSDDELLSLAHELLEPHAERELLAHVRDCAACEERFRTAAHDREFLQAAWHRRASIAASHEGLAPVTPLPARSRRRRDFSVRWTAPVAIAAALALAVLAPSLRRSADPRAAYWLPVEVEPALLRTPTNVDVQAALGTALARYGSRDPQSALAALQSLDVPQEAEFETSLRRLYLASALLVNERSAEALVELDRLDAPTLPEPWRRWATWTRYLALRDAHRDTEAAFLLHDLAASATDVGDLARRERDRISPK
jgi:hypothetical protein